VFRSISADPRITPQPQVVLLETLQGGKVLGTDDKKAFFAVMRKPVSLNTLISSLQLLDIDSDAQGAGNPAGIELRETIDPHLVGGRVLLVEDNELNQMVALGILHNAGLEVVVAGNGQEAVALAGAEEFDIILMDIQMPGMDGIEATRRIRQLPGRQTLPIIAMTAYATQEERERILASGVDEHLAKPIDFTSLLAMLKRWLGPGRKAITLDLQAGAPAVNAEAPAVDNQGKEAASVSDLPDLLAGLQQLIPALRSCKPRQCALAQEGMRTLTWPQQRTEDVQKINEYVRRYEFTEALELAESLHAEICTMSDQR